MYKNCPGNKTENFTESQNYLGWKRRWEVVQSSSCLEQRQLDPVAQDLVRFISELSKD